MFPEAKKSKCRTNWSEDAASFKNKQTNFFYRISVCTLVQVHLCTRAHVHTCACGWDRFGNRRYLSRDRGRREEERETDNENQGEVMLAWGEEDRDQK